MTPNLREIVTVYTALHAFRIDVNATIEQGFLDEDGLDTAGEAVNAVLRNFSDEIACLDADGRQVLVTGEIVATTHEMV